MELEFVSIDEEFEKAHKYLRREGSKGNWTYIYEEPKQKFVVGDLVEITEDLSDINFNIKAGTRGYIYNKLGGGLYRVESYKGKDLGSFVRWDEMKKIPKEELRYSEGFDYGLGEGVVRKSRTPGAKDIKVRKKRISMLQHLELKDILHDRGYKKGTVEHPRSSFYNNRKGDIILVDKMSGHWAHYNVHQGYVSDGEYHKLRNYLR
jgi:hypothetical protein